MSVISIVHFSCFLFVLIFLISLCLSFDLPNDTLIKTYGKVIFCSALFRHGDRTVNNPYPTDPYQLPFWWEGKAQLTKTGKVREFELGEFFRQRYDYLVKNRPYRYDFLKMRSSDVDRTLMSAELFLAGFYPPSSKEIWDEKLKWQPIPVHTLPKKMDNIIAQEMPCDKYDLELSVLNNSPEFEALFEEHQKLFDYVSKHSGLQMTKADVYSAFNKLWDVYDDLFIEEQFNLTLPTWTKTVYPNQLKEVGQFYFSIPSYTREMQRLKGGPLLKSIINDMQNKIAEPTNFTFHFYSGHDTTVAVLLDTLGVYNRLAPPYSACVVVELRERNGLHYVTVLYKNSTNNIHLLDLPHCKNPCLLDDFIEATRSVVPEDYVTECDLGFFNTWYYFTPLNIIIFVVLLLILLGGVFLIGKLHFARRKQYRHYQNIYNEAMGPANG